MSAARTANDKPHIGRAMSKRFLPLLLGCLLLVLPLRALASGSYPGRPPQPPPTIDAAKYHVGKQIFTGQAASDQSLPTAVAPQQARLQELQAALPSKAQQTVNLPALAGKLSTDRLEALEYYLASNYPGCLHTHLSAALCFKGKRHTTRFWILAVAPDADAGHHKTTQVGLCILETNQ